MVIWMSFLCTIVHISGLTLRYIPFKERIDRKKRKQLLFWYTGMLVVNFFLYLKAEENIGANAAFYKLDLLLFCTITMCINICIVKGYIKEHLFTFGLTGLIIQQIFAVAAYLLEVIGYETVLQGLVIENIIGILLYILSYFWIRRLVRNTVTPFLDINNHNYWNTIWFIPIAILLGSIFSTGVEKYTSTPIQLIGRIFTGMATVMICRTIAKDYKRIIEQTGMEKQIEYQKVYYQVLMEAVKMEREARHDFKHQLVAVQGFLEHGNIKDLEKYCETAQLKLEKITEIPHTGNAVADSILYHYACIAERKKIRFFSCCKFSTTRISDVDLCCILGNALENAITASEAFIGERYIKIAAQKENDMQLITVENSFDGILLQNKEKIFSRKRRREEGIGIQSMERVCKKYRGICRFHASGNRFEASFFLKLE